jgi:hypothetical protein
MAKRRPGPFPLVPAPLSGSREQIRKHRAEGSNLSLGERTDQIASGRTTTGRIASTVQLARKPPYPQTVCSFNAHSGAIRNFASAG